MSLCKSQSEASAKSPSVRTFRSVWHTVNFPPEDEGHGRCTTRNPKKGTIFRRAEKLLDPRCGCVKAISDYGLTMSLTFFSHGGKQRVDPELPRLATGTRPRRQRESKREHTHSSFVLIFANTSAIST
jgi:hypothetical protein